MAKIIIENLKQIDLPNMQEILNKMIAIQENLSAINKNLFDNDNLKITVDLDNQYDEFWINRKNLYIEVLNEKSAIDSDLDFLDDDEKKEYVFCEVLSNYKKLGNSKYYYREM